MPILKGVVGYLIEPTTENKKVRIKGFDTTDQVSKSQAIAMKNDGYQFCVRYIPQNPNIVKNDLTNAEAQDILDGGLALMACQHVEADGWRVSQQSGRRKGELARQWARDCGFPPGVNIWLDLELINEDQQNKASEIIEYCNIWFDTVAQFGYLPGIYVGSNSWLTGSQLFHLLKFRHYWRAPGNIPEIEIRGYQIFQGFTVNNGEMVNGLLDGRIFDNTTNTFITGRQLVHGLDIDDDVAFIDLLNESPYLIKPFN